MVMSKSRVNLNTRRRDKIFKNEVKISSSSIAISKANSAKAHLIHKWTHHQVPSLLLILSLPKGLQNGIYPIEMSIHNFKSVYRNV